MVIAVIAYYLGTRVEWPATFRTLQSVSPFYVFISTALNMLGAVTLSTVYFVIVTGRTEASVLKNVESINARVLGYSTVLPSAVVAAFKITAFQKILQSSAKAVAFFVVGKLCSLLVALLVLLFVGYSSERFLGFANRLFGSQFFFAGVVVLIATLVLATSIRPMRRRLGTMATTLLSNRLSNSLRSIKTMVDVKAWVSGVFTQSIAFFLTVGAAALLALAITPAFPVEAIFVGRAVTLIALLAPISIAGVGAREVSFLMILPLYSVNITDSAALVLLLLLTQWTAGILSFGYSFALTHNSKKKN